MIPRIISTIIAWIKSLGVNDQSDDRYFIKRTIISTIPVIELNDIQQPVLPSTGNLDEYSDLEQRIRSASNIKP